MDEYETLNHTTRDCKYHVVFIRKYRGKGSYQELRKALAEVFQQLAAQKEAKVEEGHLLFDHGCAAIHPLSTPPKYSVSSVGVTQWARARSISRGWMAKGNAISWAKAFGAGYFVSTVGHDKVVVR